MGGLAWIMAMKFCVLALLLATQIAAGAENSQVSPIEDEAMFVENAETTESSADSVEDLLVQRFPTNHKGFLEVDDDKRWICWSVALNHKRIKCARNNSANRARAKQMGHKLHKIMRKLRKKLGKPISRAAKKRAFIRKVKKALKKARKKARIIRKRKNKTWWHSIHKKDNVKGRQIKKLIRSRKSTSRVTFSTWKFYKTKVKKHG